MGYITYTLTRDDEDYDLQIDYEVAPRIKGDHHSPPPFCRPDEGGEITYFCPRHNGVEFPLTEVEVARIHEHIYFMHDYDEHFSD